MTQDITARSLCAVLGVALFVAVVGGGYLWARVIKLESQVKDLYEAIDILTEFVPKR